MKKSFLFILVSAMLIVTASAALAGPPTDPCIEAAWSPEVLTFYGSNAQVAAKLSKVQSDLLERRVYLIVSETQGRTDVALFERKEGGNVLLSKWATTSKINLAATLNEKILANAGSSCAGALTKSVLKALGDNAEEGNLIPGAKTALAAYNQAMPVPATDYVRVTVFLLC